jgi:hypothetical protein
VSKQALVVTVRGRHADGGRSDWQNDNAFRGVKTGQIRKEIVVCVIEVIAVIWH